MAKSITVIDAKKFISTLKKHKKKFRVTYTQSEKKGARLFRYIDYARLFKILEDCIIEVSIPDLEIEDTPTIVPVTFEVEKVEIDPDSDEIPSEDSEEGSEDEEDG